MNDAEDNAKPSRIRAAILSLIAVVLIAAFAYYLYINADTYRELLRLSARSAFALLLLAVGFPLLNSQINVYQFRSLGAEISYRDSFLLTTASTLANQLPISGGLISKSVYLKRRYGISYAASISSQLALFFCFVAVNGGMGMIVLLYWALFLGMSIPPMLFLGFSAMCACIVVFQLPAERIHLPGKMQHWVSEAVAGFALISKDRAMFLKLLGLQAALPLVLTAKYLIAFQMLSQQITAGEAALLANASVLSQLVSIAPGDLGIREAVVGMLASILGFDPGVSVVAVGLDRLLSTLVIFMLGGIGAHWLGRQVFDLPQETRGVEIQ